MRLHHHPADEGCGNDWCLLLRSGDWRKHLADTPHWSGVGLTPFNRTDLDELHQSLSDICPHLLATALVSAEMTADNVSDIYLPALWQWRALSENEVWWLRYLTYIAALANHFDSEGGLDGSEVSGVLADELAACFVSLAVSFNLPIYNSPPPDVRATLRQIADRIANNEPPSAVIKAALKRNQPEPPPIHLPKGN